MEKCASKACVPATNLTLSFRPQSVSRANATQRAPASGNRLSEAGPATAERGGNYLSSNVPTTARWSDGQGVTTMSAAGAASPTTWHRLAVTALPAKNTKSMRS